MLKISQSGFMQVLLMVLLVIGIGLGVFLVQNQTNFFPEAAELKDYLFATHCEADNQCKAGNICQMKTCNADAECKANPRGAMCAVKLRFCGGTCVAGTRSATPSASLTPVATSSATPSGEQSPAGFSAPRISSPAERGGSNSSPNNNVSCAQVATKACQKNNPKFCITYPNPCAVPSDWVISK